VSRNNLSKKTTRVNLGFERDSARDLNVALLNEEDGESEYQGMSSGSVSPASGNVEVVVDKGNKKTLDSTLSKINYNVHMNNYMIGRNALVQYYLIQMTLIALSFYISLMATHYTNVIATDWNVKSESGRPTIDGVFLALLGWLVPLISTLAFFAFMISPFTILTSVDNRTSHQTIVFALNRHKTHELRDETKRQEKLKPKSSHPLAGHNHDHAHGDLNNIVDRSIDYFSGHESKEDLQKLQNTIDELIRRKEMIEKLVANQEKFADESRPDTVFGEFYYNSDTTKKKSRSRSNSTDEKEPETTQEHASTAPANDEYFSPF
jgi:hypothetical protein